MVFSRLFKGDPKKDSGAESDAQAETAPDDADDHDADEDVVERDAPPDVSWAERAAAVLPTGSSTGSKRMEALWGAADAHAPSHYFQASGCRVTTSDDDMVIDCTMALGAVSLGYADERVTAAVVSAMAAGNVSGLPHALEVDVA